MNIIKPNNDNRIYKYYLLKNNIKCILINDAKLDKSYIVSAINTGSFADKEYYAGIAHLLEHMCFITSKNYKKKDYLAHKIAESGGNTNAFTDDLNTIYYLDIFTENLEYILNIFIDFLTNAELKKEYILSELNNVDSEHKKNIFNDIWRLLNLKKLLADPNSNYHGFYTGSIETLNKPDIHEKIKEFYTKYYTSNNISICIASNKNIDELVKIINIYINKIPLSNINNKLLLIKPIYSINKGKTYFMEALSEIYQLEYIFEIFEYNINSKIYILFSNIINSPENNLLYDYLKLLGLIISIYASFDLNGIVNISIILSEYGFINIIYVDNIVKYFINSILLFDWKKINNYNKVKNNFLFHNLSNIDILDLSINFLQNLLYYEPTNIYYGDYDYKDITEIDIINLKKYINFTDVIRIIVSKKYRYKTTNIKYMIDPFYNTKYTTVNIFNKNINIIKNNTINYNYNNKYSNIKPLHLQNINYHLPIKLHNRLWYGGTSDFNEAIFFCDIIFSNSKYYSTPKNYLLTVISINILNYYINKQLYKAIEFNYLATFKIMQNINSIGLHLYLYNDINYQQKFINDIFDILFKNNIILSDNLIISNISFIKNNLKSIITYSPWEFCNYIFKSFYNNTYLYTDLLCILNNISCNEIKKFIKNIFNKSGIYIIIYGNINKQNIPNFNKFNKHFNYSINIFPKFKIPKLISIKHPNIKEKSNCVKISYFIGQFKPLEILHFIFIKLITSTIFFEELRTTKQLGYLVHMGGTMINNNYYLYQQIQSEIECNKIIHHIKLFNNTLIKHIQGINLKKWKQTVYNHLTIRYNNTYELYNKYYFEIIYRTFIFNKNELMLQYINDISIHSLITFINKYILNNNKIYIIQIYN